MTATDLELRIAALEKKVESLAAPAAPATNKDWVLKIWGSFAGDPDFEKAMHYGRKWRKSENAKSIRGVKKGSPRKPRK